MVGYQSFASVSPDNKKVAGILNNSPNLTGVLLQSCINLVGFENTLEALSFGSNSGRGNWGVALGLALNGDVLQIIGDEAAAKGQDVGQFFDNLSSPSGSNLAGALYFPGGFHEAPDNSNTVDANMAFTHLMGHRCNLNDTFSAGSGIVAAPSGKTETVGVKVFNNAGLAPITAPHNAGSASYVGAASGASVIGKGEGDLNFKAKGSLDFTSAGGISTLSNYWSLPLASMSSTSNGQSAIVGSGYDLGADGSKTVVENDGETVLRTNHLKLFLQASTVMTDANNVGELGLGFNSVVVPVSSSSCPVGLRQLTAHGSVDSSGAAIKKYQPLDIFNKSNSSIDALTAPGSFTTAATTAGGTPNNTCTSAIGEAGGTDSLAGVQVTFWFDENKDCYAITLSNAAQEVVADETITFAHGGNNWVKQGTDLVLTCGTAQEAFLGHNDEAWNIGCAIKNIEELSIFKGKGELASDADMIKVIDSKNAGSLSTIFKFKADDIVTHAGQSALSELFQQYNTQGVHNFLTTTLGWVKDSQNRYTDSGVIVDSQKFRSYTTQIGVKAQDLENDTTILTVLAADQDGTNGSYFGAIADDLNLTQPQRLLRLDKSKTIRDIVPGNNFDASFVNDASGVWGALEIYERKHGSKAAVELYHDCITYVNSTSQSALWTPLGNDGNFFGSWNNSASGITEERLRLSSVGYGLSNSGGNGEENFVGILMAWMARNYEKEYYENLALGIDFNTNMEQGSYSHSSGLSMKSVNSRNVTSGAPGQDWWSTLNFPFSMAIINLKGEGTNIYEDNHPFARAVVKHFRGDSNNRYNVLSVMKGVLAHIAEEKGVTKIAETFLLDIALSTVNIGTAASGNLFNMSNVAFTAYNDTTNAAYVAPYDYNVTTNATALGLDETIPHANVAQHDEFGSVAFATGSVNNRQSNLNIRVLEDLGVDFAELVSVTSKFDAGNQGLQQHTGSLQASALEKNVGAYLLYQANHDSTKTTPKYSFIELYEKFNEEVEGILRSQVVSTLTNGSTYFTADTLQSIYYKSLTESSGEEFNVVSELIFDGIRDDPQLVKEFQRQFLTTNYADQFGSAASTVNATTAVGFQAIAKQIMRVVDENVQAIYYLAHHDASIGQSAKENLKKLLILHALGVIQKSEDDKQKYIDKLAKDMGEYNRANQINSIQLASYTMKVFMFSNEGLQYSSGVQTMPAAYIGIVNSATRKA